MYMRVWSSQPYQMFHIESAFEFHKCIRLNIYIYLQILLVFTWHIYFWNRSVMLTNNACCFMRQKWTGKFYSTTLDTWNLLMHQLHCVVVSEARGYGGIVCRCVNVTWLANRNNIHWENSHWSSSTFNWHCSKPFQCRSIRMKSRMEYWCFLILC